VAPTQQRPAGRITTPGGELIAAHERLREALEALAEDQMLIADLMRRVGELGREVDPDNVAQVSAELESLAAILESHFSWEERKLAQLEPETEPQPA
jgi:hypothetical protein